MDLPWHSASIRRLWKRLDKIEALLLSHSPPSAVKPTEFKLNADAADFVPHRMCAVDPLVLCLSNILSSGSWESFPEEMKREVPDRPPGNFEREPPPPHDPDDGRRYGPRRVRFTATEDCAALASDYDTLENEAEFLRPANIVDDVDVEQYEFDGVRLFEFDVVSFEFAELCNALTNLTLKRYTFTYGNDEHYDEMISEYEEYGNDEHYDDDDSEYEECEHFLYESGWLPEYG